MPATRYLLALIVLFALEAQAKGPPYQADWTPNAYKLVCNPADSCIHGPEVHRKTAELMPRAVDGVRGLGFGPPALWGMRVDPDDSPAYVEVYEKPKATIAQAIAICSTTGSGEALVNSHINIGSTFEQYDRRDHLLYYFMAHEVFHLLAYEHRFFKPTCQQVPGWIFEGMATAVGQAATRKVWPGKFPERVDDRVAENFSGLRRYDNPLPHRAKNKKGEEEFSGDTVSYRTSSFWRHLAEAHHMGSYRFLGRYMDRMDWKGDWVGWLRANVEDSTGIDLGMVHAGFLADYAGWGDEDFPGTYYGRERWLDESFGGCETVYLNKQEAVGYVELDLLPLSGKCVEVRVSAIGEGGVDEGESAAVQIAGFIMAGSRSVRDGLHLGLAFSNDKKSFHCAREVKRKRLRGLGQCIFVPDDGKIRVYGGHQDARLWNVIAQEKGNSEEMRQEPGRRRGEIANVYTVSYTPTNVSSEMTAFGGKDPVTVGLYFILDVAKVKMEGQEKKGAVGTFDGGADPQTTVPKVNSAGQRVNSYAKPEEFQPRGLAATAGMGMALPPQFHGKLSYFWVAPTADNAEPGANSLMVYSTREREGGKLEEFPLDVGFTGTVPAGFMANLNGEPATGFVEPPGTVPGTLTVEEFSDLVFRARFQGKVCRLKDIETDPKLKLQKPCRNPVEVSGEIVKAFAGTRLPGYHMVTERTPGTEMYRKSSEAALAGQLPGASPGETLPGAGSPPPGSGSSGGTLPDCACTCEEYAETGRLMEDFKQRHEAGQDVEMSEMNQLMRCQGSCQSQYMACAMEEERQNREREKAAAEQREQELAESGACDCSCPGLAAMRDKLESILQSGQVSSPSGMNEMQALGECMSVCQSQLMSCNR